jgi:hypothetical protein
MRLRAVWLRLLHAKKEIGLGQPGIDIASNFLNV